MLYIILLVIVCCVRAEPKFYDSYTGNVITDEEVAEHVRRNTTFWCINEILPCDPSEGKRIDGSCNNLKHPSRGAAHTPIIRLLPAVYDKNYEPRRSKSGAPLPLSRAVRTGVLAEGRVPDSRFTQLMTHFWVYIAVDFISVHDTSYHNLVKDGVISPHKGFRDEYDENVLPQMSLEVFLVHRWAHTMQEGKLKLYDTNGYYLKEDKLVNLTFRTGYLVDNLEYIAQGAFRQPSGRYDYIVDPDIAETIFGPVNLAADVVTSDLSKSRYFGFAPYVHYRAFCTGKTYKTFEDLLDVIDPERILLLKEKYKHVEDIDLMTGIWMERPVKGGYVPATFYCIAVEQFRRTVVSDRHWYERPNRPNAFTLEQLQEIRKATIALFMCVVEDGVTEIQPRAFLLPGKGNEIRSCKEIPMVDLKLWKDSKCEADHKESSHYN